MCGGEKGEKWKGRERVVGMGDVARGGVGEGERWRVCLRGGFFGVCAWRIDLFRLRHTDGFSIAALQD